jgi:hypothetical protein
MEHTASTTRALAGDMGLQDGGTVSNTQSSVYSFLLANIPFCLFYPCPTPDTDLFQVTPAAPSPALLPHLSRPHAMTQLPDSPDVSHNVRLSSVVTATYLLHVRWQRQDIRPRITVLYTLTLQDTSPRQLICARNL